MTENERVRIIRKDLGLTMEEFGKRLGVAKNTISQIESGKNALSNQMAAAIIREFGVNETWLRTGDGEMRPQKTPDDEITDLFAELLNAPPDDSVRSLARAFAKLTPDQRRQACDLVKSLAEAYNQSADHGAAPAVAEAEALYESSLGFAPSTTSTASNTTAATAAEKASNQ